jgi:uncharacterized protein YkwD
VGSACIRRLDGLSPSAARSAGSRGRTRSWRRLAAAVALLWGFALTAPAGVQAVDDCAGADVVPTPQDVRSFERSTLCLLNAKRSSAGFRVLSTRPLLSRAAAGYSAQMVRESFFAHQAPAGPDLAGRLTRAGYLSHAATDWFVGENLGWATGTAATPRQLVAAWMASPGHRRNILEPAFRDIGIGMASGTPASGPDGLTVTTDFGTRHIRAARRRRARVRPRPDRLPSVGRRRAAHQRASVR